MQEGQELPPEPQQHTLLMFLRTLVDKVRRTIPENPIALEDYIEDSDSHEPKIMAYCIKGGSFSNLILEEGINKDNVYTIEYPKALNDPTGKVESVRGVFKIRNSHSVLTDATISYKNKKHKLSGVDFGFHIMVGVRVTDPKGEVTIVELRPPPTKMPPALSRR
jgi:hypothetical protein